ncbi:sigma factor-like helix-turn-helix DNA-binding protein [Streptomyces profundus]|uniref:sigma factor-like helix-turn-helix DNA-binding protein n=1 Tax=Streptomyces profundus TaxID=2867410 RepID=UPI001D160326|nr:sigma factor-like helix-turn-helix DNA-binding protein [Streptomyces sp. MA3_2.13]UED84547.1 RNA polymerase subunit sigma-70 [Streptomyces sp. MA3_2.13]
MTPVAQLHAPRVAFQRLYEARASSLVRQALLLSGDREIGDRALAHAFRLAWERWPEVATDRDPAGWVRATCHEFALSPWHQLTPNRWRRPVDVHAEHRPLLDGLLALPRGYRRALLLRDGVGLGLAETAAECEATTAATESRVEHARAALAERLPTVAAAAPAERGPLIGALLARCADTLPVRPAPAPAALDASERTTRRIVGAATALVTGTTVALVGSGLLTALH